MEQNLKDKCAQYAQDNPICIYGDYRDELPSDIIDHLLNGDIDSAIEAMCECEINMQGREAFDEWLENENIELQEDENIELYEIWCENIYFDFDDFWDTCFRNTRVQVAITPIKRTGETIMFTREENQYLKKVHGWSCEQAESLYPEIDDLKVFGTIDLKELYENLRQGKKPRAVSLQSGNCIPHNSINGSGGQLLPSSKSKAMYKIGNITNDAQNRYGVQSVFGFVESLWREEMMIKYA